MLSTGSGTWRILSSQPQEDLFRRAASYEKTWASSQNLGTSRRMSTRVTKQEHCPRASLQVVTRASAKNQVSICPQGQRFSLWGQMHFPCCSPPLAEQRIRSLFLSPLTSSCC